VNPYWQTVVDHLDNSEVVLNRDECRRNIYLDVTIHNANPDPLTNIPLFVILEAAGTFWYHPAWSMEPLWETLSIIPTESMGIPILSPFQWPDNAGNEMAQFWGAVTDASMTRVLGNYDVRDFEPLRPLDGRIPPSPCGHMATPPLERGAFSCNR